MAAVTLPTGQKEGIWSLVIEPPIVHRGDFHGGGVLADIPGLSSWVGFSLAQPDTVQIYPFNYPNDPIPFNLELFKDQGNQATRSIWGPTLVTPGQNYTTPLLDAGFYIALANSTAGKDFFGLSLLSPNLFGGVSGGWLDSVTGVGFAAFDIPIPRKVTFKLLFGSNYGELGSEQPHLEVYYQKADGTRDLTWSAPKSTPTDTPTDDQPTEEDKQTLGISVVPVVDPETDLGVIATHDNGEIVGIFGIKDSEGRLTSIERIVVSSQEPNKSMEIVLDENYLPRSLKFPDNSRLDLDEYTNDGATVTYYDPDGNESGQTTLTLPMDEVNDAIGKLKGYFNSPLPTQNNPIPSSSSDPILWENSICVDVVNLFYDAIDNLVWGAFQLVSAYSCAASVTTAFLTGGMATPIAIWACGSVILNGIDKMADAISKGNSPLKKGNQINDVASTAFNCITKRWVDCLQGLAPHVINQALKNSKEMAQEICEKDQPQYEEGYCHGFAEFCEASNGVKGIYKNSCSCNISDIGHPALCEHGENPCGVYYHDHCWAGGHMCLDVGKEWPR